ncbi:MAG TPA: formyltransferase family protein, partial [Phycisphaerae bacterium]|nr:formyltransferase family protein [Phycisphaerae bacterium]
EYLAVPEGFVHKVEGISLDQAAMLEFLAIGAHAVRRAGLAAGERESGCTVHLVDLEYDHGPIVAQRRVPVLPGDTPDTLADRVQAAERELYPEVVQAVVERGLEWLGGK